MSSNNQDVVRLRIKDVKPCMTCPICNKLVRKATCIPECLHTFCRKCIHKKLIDEELECCPICDTDLGCVPLEKLRPDHSLSFIRGKIFPSKRKRVESPEVVPSVTLPLRRKERSLSSLVVSTPRVSPQTTLTGKRSKVPVRKKPRGSFSADKSFKKEESMEDHQDSSSSREISKKFTQKLRQDSPTSEPSSDPSPDKETKNGKVDLWKPLNFLVEVANRSKSTTQGSNVKSELKHTPKSVGYSRKPKGKDNLKPPKFQDENERSDADVTESAKPKKIRKYRKNKAGSQAVMDADANSPAHEKRINPIWFHLVPSEEQEGEPLGQIDGSFIKLKHGNIPISFIQKFVLSKLKLGSEQEIELRCMGQSLQPTLQLGNLMELWLQKQPTSKTVSVTIGSSAKEYMMEISYAKKSSRV